MDAPGEHAFTLQLPGELPCAHEGMFQVQFIQATYQCEISRQRRLGQVIDGPPTDAEQLGLTGDGQCVLAVDHRFALSNPALLSACSKKSFSSAS